MGALMKYWNDPATLAKIGERMGSAGDPQAAVAATAQRQAPSPASIPEINNLLDAAKCATWIHCLHLKCGMELLEC
jgi:hypothetical protein